MENNLENLTIGVFAKAAGVNVETIRFYQRKGLLREPDKPYGSIRRYGEADAAWPNTSSRTCARRWPTWRAWKPCCLNSCAPAMHERGMFPAR